MKTINQKSVNTSINKNLSFNDKPLQIVNLNDNQIWITSKSLAEALDYSREDNITLIYKRHQNEFTEKMSKIAENINLAVSENLITKTRIFSLRGCHLISMFSKTKVAKDFRKWVLDILDKEVKQKDSEWYKDIKITAEEEPKPYPFLEIDDEPIEWADILNHKKLNIVEKIIEKNHKEAIAKYKTQNLFLINNKNIFYPIKELFTYSQYQKYSQEIYRAIFRMDDDKIMRIKHIWEHLCIREDAIDELKQRLKASQYRKVEEVGQYRLSA